LNGTASYYVTGPAIFAGRDESAGYDPAILIPSLGEYDLTPSPFRSWARCLKLAIGRGKFLIQINDDRHAYQKCF